MVIGKGKEKANSLRCGKYWDSCTAHCTLNNILERMSLGRNFSTAGSMSEEQTENQDLLEFPFLKNDAFLMSQLFPISCYEKTDILKYVDSKHHCFQATPGLLQNTFDYYMLSYCAMRFYSLNGCNQDVSAYLNDCLSEERRKIETRRKKYPDWLRLCSEPRGPKRNLVFFLPEFAFRAAQDILCKTAYLRPNATEKRSSLQLHSHFISEASLKNNKGYFIVRPADEADFDLEDYFYYEYFTGVNLALETTAALIEITAISPEIFDVKYIWDNIKGKITSLVQSPMLLSRNAIARYYVLEIRNEYKNIQQDQQFGVEINGGASKNKPLLNSAIKRAIERVDIEAAKLFIPCKTESFHMLNRDKNLSERSPYESRQGSNEPVADVGVVYKPYPICNYICQDNLAWERAAEYFKANLLTVVDPVNPSEFLKNSRYGPIVFCNMNHAGIKDILDMIDVNAKEFNIYRDRSKPSRLFQKVHKEIYDSIDKTSKALERCFTIPVDSYVNGKP